MSCSTNMYSSELSQQDRTLLLLVINEMSNGKYTVFQRNGLCMGSF